MSSSPNLRCTISTVPTIYLAVLSMLQVLIQFILTKKKKKSYEVDIVIIDFVFISEKTEKGIRKSLVYNHTGVGTRM